MKLVLATHNQGKIKELTAALAPYYADITSAAALNLPEPEETGTTLQENALLKAKAVASAMPDCAVLADDSGIAINNLPQWDAVYTKNYVKKHGGYAVTTTHILQQLGNKSPAVHYQSFILLLMPNGMHYSGYGTFDGELIDVAQGVGENGFGFDPYFYVPHYKRTVAQLTVEEKNAVSHRGIALKKLLEQL